MIRFQTVTTLPERCVKHQGELGARSSGFYRVGSVNRARSARRHAAGSLAQPENINRRRPGARRRVVRAASPQHVSRRLSYRTAASPAARNRAGSRSPLAAALRIPLANFTRTSDDRRGAGSLRSASTRTDFRRLIVSGSNAAAPGLSIISPLWVLRQAERERFRRSGLSFHVDNPDLIAT